MDKIKPPRDSYRLKSKVVGGFLNFTNTKGWVCLCLIFATGIFWLFGIRDANPDYAGYWIAFVILFAVLPQIVFRVILKYRDVPKGWTLEQFRAWRKLENSPFVVDGRSILGRIFDPYGIIKLVVGRLRQRRTGHQISMPVRILVAVWSPLTFIGLISIIFIFKIHTFSGVLIIVAGLGWSITMMNYFLKRKYSMFNNNQARIAEISYEVKNGLQIKIVTGLWFAMLTGLLVATAIIGV